MQVLNLHSNQDGSKFQVFWDAKYQFIETYTESVAHIQYHAKNDKETTLNVLYATSVTSMSQFIEKIHMLIVDTDKKGGSRLMCPVFVLGLPAISAL